MVIRNASTANSRYRPTKIGCFLSIIMSEKKFNKLLIKSVKKYPALYDSKCKDYRNRYLKQTVWDKLAAHLDSEGRQLVIRY